MKKNALEKRTGVHTRSMVMGLETFIPPFAMDAAAPMGAPRRPQLPDFLETVLTPLCPARGPEAGSAHIHCKYFTDFHDFGMNRMGSYPFLQSHILQSAKTFPNGSL